jgi:AcrR family transcriptional regulator
MRSANRTKVHVESPRVTNPIFVEPRRRRIVEAATKLMAVRGFSDTTIRDIADEAGISIGQIYCYVSSKEDILVLAVDYWRDVWLRGLSRVHDPALSPEDQLQEVMLFLVEMGAAHPTVSLLVNRESGRLVGPAAKIPKDLERALVGAVADILSQIVPGQDDLEVKRIAIALVLLSQGWVLKGYLSHTLFDGPRSYALWTTEIGLNMIHELCERDTA